MRKIIVILILLLLFISCSEKEKMKYEKNITYIYKTEKSIEGLAKNERELPTQCNLYFMDEYKVETSGLSFLSPKDADNYVYGEKIIFDYKLLLYSNEYLPQKDESGNIFYGEITGFILLSDHKKVKTLVKVFYSKVDSEELLYAYLYDEYIIIIKIIDYDYDIMIEDKDDNVTYSFVVIELTKDIEMRFLEEQEGRRVAKKYLASHEVYKSRF